MSSDNVYKELSLKNLKNEYIKNREEKNNLIINSESIQKFKIRLERKEGIIMEEMKRRCIGE